MATASDTLVVWNSKSGKADQIATLRDLLADRKPVWIDLSETDDLTESLRVQMEQNASPSETPAVDGQATDPKTLIVAGGDGTVNAAVNAIMALDSENRPRVAIVPLGTANDFARSLEIPNDPADALALLDQPPVGVDLVKISGNGDDRFYANIAAGGNCVRVSEAMTDDVKSRWGALSYMRGAVEVLPDMQTYRTQLQCDDELLADLDVWAVLVANGRTNAGGIEVAPKASPNDGMFDLVVIHGEGVGDMAEIVAKNLLGNFLECEQVIFRQARTLNIQSDPPMRFTIDGEVVDREPVCFEIVPSAILMHAFPGDTPV